MKHKAIVFALLAASFALAGCNKTGSSSNTNTGGNNTGGSGGDVPSSKPYVPAADTGVLANGRFDYSQDSWQHRAEALYSLEKYALDNFTAGIPLYDDASYEQFSDRVTLPSTNYLTNYGFGTAYGTIDPDGTMYNGTISESVPEWRSYFHGYTTVDSGTFNGWNSSGSDVSDRMSMIASSYFGVKANSTNTDYSWEGSLSVTDEPIMLDSWGGDPVPNPTEDQTSQYWRVKVHYGEGYTYSVAPTSRYQQFNGREIALEDYLTPFKAMLDGRLLRFTDLVTDASGFQGAMEYVYSTNKPEWEDSGVMIQINEEEGAIEFGFITPQSTSFARTSLSSMFYSPIPEEFITTIGGGDFVKGASAYGTRSGTGTEDCFDNILVLGPYIPVYWEDQVKIVYDANDTYYEADDYHYEGYSEVMFTGSNADELAYEAFMRNELDEVTIPVDYLQAHRNDPNVLRTEGSTIIKLNINSTTREQWMYYFGPDGTIYPSDNPDDYWAVKPIMSNKNFLNGFYFAMNRQELADMSGKNPAVGYLSNAYMIDPSGRQSFRESIYGQSVVWERQVSAGNAECYSPALAQDYFDLAGRELVEAGYYQPGQTITIRGIFRYQSTIDNLGAYIKSYVEDAFNIANANNGTNLKIVLDLKVGGNTYNETYTLMDHGQFDFAEGAVSGVVLNPLDFMNTCSSTKSINQGFCLNWGMPTNTIDEESGAYCVFDGLRWSYDALWSATQGFTMVENGITSVIADNQEIRDDGENVTFYATYPANATDELGNLIVEFEPSGIAMLFGATASPDSGFYLNEYDWQVSLNGYMTLSVSKEHVRELALNYSSKEGTPAYFGFNFTLLYTVESGGNTITKSVIINIVGRLSDYGITL